MAAQPILITHDLRKSFGYVEAVRNVNLEVYPCEAFGLLGPNGAGKTTIIGMILGLIQLTAGTLTLFGEPHHARHLLDGDRAEPRVAHTDHRRASFHPDSRQPARAVERVDLLHAFHQYPGFQGLDGGAGWRRGARARRASRGRAARLFAGAGRVGLCLLTPYLSTVIMPVAHGGGLSRPSPVEKLLCTR